MVELETRLLQNGRHQSAAQIEQWRLAILATEDIE